jgi:hypothetical protein
MASNQTGRTRGRLNARGGRTVVFCHAYDCHHEWYEDEYGIAACPRCRGEAVEVVCLAVDLTRLSISLAVNMLLTRLPGYARK